MGLAKCCMETKTQVPSLLVLPWVAPVPKVNLMSVGLLHFQEESEGEGHTLLPTYGHMLDTAALCPWGPLSLNWQSATPSSNRGWEALSLF